MFMSEFKGTQGKFQIIKSDSLKDFKILCIGSDSDNKVIAHIYFEGEITEKELANAVLLAHSKELLYKLKESVETIEWLMDKCSPDIISDRQTFYDLGMNTKESAKDLIKQATEL